MNKSIALGALLVTSLGLVAWSRQDAGQAPAEKTVKKVAVKATPANSGEKMYKEYCAACHGVAGKGDGPAASALKMPPPDLTLLAKNNGGKFPADRVSSVLRFGAAPPAHGSKDMPIWGSLLGRSGTHGPSPGELQLRITNLTKYVESLQAK